MTEWQAFLIGLGDNVPTAEQWAWVKAYVERSDSGKVKTHPEQTLREMLGLPPGWVDNGGVAIAKGQS